MSHISAGLALVPDKDRDRVRKVLLSLAEAWSDADFYGAMRQALVPLIPGGLLVLFSWNGEQHDVPAPLVTDIDDLLKSPWFATGTAERLRPYHPVHFIYPTA